MTLDVPLLSERLDRYAANIDQYNARDGGEEELTDILDWLVIHAPLTEEILLRVGEPFVKADLSAGWDHPGRAFLDYRGPCLRAMGRLGDLEIIESLKPRGPQLSATGLHPWVWEGALSLWGTGHYREALAGAGRRVNAEVQNKVGRRDIAEATLFQSVFSSNGASPAEPRLRILPDDGGPTPKNVQRGARMIAEGWFAAIWNPVAHDEGELGEDEALEQLAALSIVARWADSATVER